jgi:hypothetical protein
MIRMEYLPHGAADCPLIRLFDWSCDDIATLRSVCLSLAESRIREIAVHDQPWVRSIDGCRLLLRLGRTRDVALNGGGDSAFVMERSAVDWHVAADILEPFCSQLDGFNWLADGSGVKVVVSRHGGW